MPKRLACAVVAALVGLTLLPPVTRADGDPASDVLLGENVFYPYSPPTSASLQKSLGAATAAAAKAGFPLKVALIASPVDLGVIPDLFNKPQSYADFLDQEISFQKRQPLLVVMPAGFGSSGLSPAATSALKSLAKPAGGASNDLASAALPAVSKLAAAEGHPIKGLSGSGSSGSGSGSGTIILIVLVLAALATAGALIANWRRRARAPA